jgi:predicted PurR-regulated permease PerM
LLGSLVLVVGILRWARDVIIPVSIAILLTFILSPVVNSLRRRGLGRPFAVIITVVCAFALLGFAGASITLQFRGLANELPNYRQNILHKISDLRGASKGGAIQKVRDTVNEVLSELNKPEPNTTNAPSAVPVVVTDQKVSSAAAPLLGPLLDQLATAGLVIVLVIFMLLQREDLRGRLLRLAGNARLAANTKAVDEAGKLVSSYLLRQCLVNSGFGLGLGLGVYFIGLPYAVLWGFLGGVCRFVPYAGPILGAGSPMLVSLAVFDGWTAPLLVIGLVCGLELINNLILEPLLYGRTTGISPVALLVMVAFWTWLWGPIGLLLATPITVCLMVITKNIPGLEFIPILLGSEPALTPHQLFYERLVAKDEAEANVIMGKFLQNHSRAELFDQLLIPALAACRHDRNRRRLSRRDQEFVFHSVRQCIEASECTVLPNKKEPKAASAPTEFARNDGRPGRPLIVGYPAGDEADELALLMLADVLRAEDWEMNVLSPCSLVSERLSALHEQIPAVVCCCSLPEGRISLVRQMCKAVRARFPHLPIVAELWSPAPPASGKPPHRLTGLSDAIAFTLAEAKNYVVQFAQLEPSAVST